MPSVCFTSIKISHNVTAHVTMLWGTAIVILGPLKVLKTPTDQIRKTGLHINTKQQDIGRFAVSATLFVKKAFEEQQQQLTD